MYIHTYIHLMPYQIKRFHIILIRSGPLALQMLLNDIHNVKQVPLKFPLQPEHHSLRHGAYLAQLASGYYTDSDHQVWLLANGGKYKFKGATPIQHSIISKASFQGGGGKAVPHGVDIPNKNIFQHTNYSYKSTEAIKFHNSSTMGGIGLGGMSHECLVEVHSQSAALLGTRQAYPSIHQSLLPTSL